MKRNYKQELELFLKAKYEGSGSAVGCRLLYEHTFHPHRRWRFDWAVDHSFYGKIAIEYEGMAYRGGKSGHTTIKGFENNCEKYNEAALMGWKVLRFTAKMIETGLAFKQLENL